MGSCADCRYSQIDHDDDGSFEDGPLLRCHRFPPQLLALDGDVAQSWPNVTETDWCGEHAAAGSATPTDTGPSTRSEAGGGELVRPVGERRAEQPARPVAGSATPGRFEATYDPHPFEADDNGACIVCWSGNTGGPLHVAADGTVHPRWCDLPWGHEGEHMPRNHPGFPVAGSTTPEAET
jgi:hypothetical protein